ncbi:MULTISPECIES: hypothetical protein [unclassified Beijerinckia]|uniref:hypothetical protein n=1 Tax=unclassified Beijerinckia TaxID=2638183 RepID=UPI000895C365|nr:MULTISPECIES: hypothetical protein [unclassified Beijerinckia]MDH7797726.1 hypothetical protein [Beijerinckia sp. GAS462]SEC96469.1 tRNA(Ile2) 2-agmatinylcytidine synthetase [Beijerinckia sp. 28-YEA-48]
MVLVGIDDTDNLESHGTGYLSRQLGALITASAIGEVQEITRHQLLFDRRIPYTSHNSSLCLRIELPSADTSTLAHTCRNYLLENSAEGSDAGLCIVAWNAVPSIAVSFGFRAKQEILTLAEARDLARREALLLEGLTGDHGGMIGALAAVGLRKSGRDGRIAWRPGLRETRGIVTATHLLTHAGVDVIRSAHSNEPIEATARINVRPWPRSVMIEGQAVLLVEPAGSPYDHFDWQLASKDILRQF